MRHMRMDGTVNKPSQDTLPLMILSRSERTYLSSSTDYAGLGELVKSPNLDWTATDDHNCPHRSS